MMVWIELYSAIDATKEVLLLVAVCNSNNTPAGLLAIGGSIQVKCVGHVGSI